MTRSSLSLCCVCIYFLLRCHDNTTGDVTNIQLNRDVDDNQSYKGKVEVWALTPALLCDFLGINCDYDWFAICHDGSDDHDHQSWDRAAATTACKQLGYQAGWGGSRAGITTRNSVEGFKCTDDNTSLDDCSYDDPEECGCSSKSSFFSSNSRCQDHWQQNQAYVECYNLADVKLHLQDLDTKLTDTVHQGKLEVRYRGELYDVCYNGHDDGEDTDNNDWSINEANVACRQLGFPLGAKQTSKLHLNSSRQSFDDFRCNVDEHEDNLFSCFPDPPSSSSCGDNNLVFIICNVVPEAISSQTERSQGHSTGQVFSTVVPEAISSQTERSQGHSTGQVFSTALQGTTQTNNINANENALAQNSSTDRGMIIGTAVGAVLVVVIIIAGVIWIVQYNSRNGKKQTKSEPPNSATTTTHTNETFDNVNDNTLNQEADYAIVHDVSDDAQNKGGDYAYAYAHYNGRGNRLSTQPLSNSFPGDQAGIEDNEGWADNVAYASHGDDGDDQEGWKKNTIYAED